MRHTALIGIICMYVLLAARMICIPQYSFIALLLCMILLDAYWYITKSLTKMPVQE